MKAIIDGKRYNTDTPQLIGEADNVGKGADSASDFSFWSASLYRTQRGNYFLAGRGGPASMFGEPVGRSGAWTGGSGIIPFLSPEEAQKWAERHLDTEAVEQFFGEEIEDA